MEHARSRYTLAEPWDDGRGLLVNAFSGAVDIVPGEVARFVKSNAALSPAEADPILGMLVERGYYVESWAVEDRAARWIAETARRKALETNEPKYVFSLTLGCNLACGYCWQAQERGVPRGGTGLMSAAMVEAAFAYVEADLERRGRSRARAVISLFGGEPLADTAEHHRLVRDIGGRCRDRGLRLHFTTNGRQLGAFLEEIREFRPSIQVTVDGADLGGDRPVLLRAGRPLHGLYETLLREASRMSDRIVLRFLLHPGRAPDFARLADRLFAEDRPGESLALAAAPVQNKSAAENPEIPPKARILAEVVDALSSKPYSRRILFMDWRSLNLFNGLREGLETLPFPVFYHCEANLDLTCFDHEGRVYACYESIGDEDQAVGTYWPEVRQDARRTAEFRGRSAFSMETCAACSLSPLCGGGCEVRGYKKNGAYGLPYCDDLQTEVRQTMIRWREISSMMLGKRPD